RIPRGGPLRTRRNPRPDHVSRIFSELAAGKLRGAVGTISSEHMSDTVIVALISSGGSVLVAVTALLLNYRGFASIDGRFAALESSINGRIASLERRLEVIERDIKEFYKLLGIHDTEN